MIWKSVLIPAALLQLVTQMYQHGATAAEAPKAKPTAIHLTTSSSPYLSGPALESILYNPAVPKKQLSKNTVQATGYRPGGKSHFIIHFRKEELHGEWQSFYSNGHLCDSGRFYRNIPTGVWKTWYPDGRLRTIRYYSAEKYHYVKADVQRAHPKDQRYALTKWGSKKAARYFQPHYETGPDMNRSLSMLQKIQHNTSSGEDKSYLPPFAASLHHGEFVNYGENGAVIDSGHYSNGLPHGLWKEAVGDGTMQALGFYAHGVRHGQWKYYDNMGRLVYTERYNANGKRSNAHYFK